jgi:hypothetical protein
MSSISGVTLFNPADPEIILRMFRAGAGPAVSIETVPESARSKSSATEGVAVSSKAVPARPFKRFRI